MKFQLGDKVKVKSARELLRITGISQVQEDVTLKSGLVFKKTMLSFAGAEGIVTEIVEPEHKRKGEKNQLKKPSYRIGQPEIFWTAELLDKVK